MPRQPRTDAPLGSDAAKARRALQVDLSGLTDEQRASREALIRLGEAAYGDRWQAHMGELLERTPQQIGAWVAGRRAVPQAVVERLPALAHDAAEALDTRAAVLRHLAGASPEG